MGEALEPTLVLLQDGGALLIDLLPRRGLRETSLGVGLIDRMEELHRRARGACQGSRLAHLAARSPPHVTDPYQDVPDLRCHVHPSSAPLTLVCAGGTVIVESA